jgi:dolichol-phosphate mannosyltransferase
MLTASSPDAVRRPLPSFEGLWIVVPTYNEIDNLAPLLAGLTTALQRAGHEFRALVVDDGSPDGTGALADRLAAADPRIAVLHRTARTGLGDAYVAGFTAALAAGAQLVVQMDCDGSHDPAAVPELVAAAATADLVLGSRYVPGGATPDWSLRRRIVSRGGSLYARTLLGLAARDLTGGFKCWRRGALSAALARPLALQGYGFQVELTHRAAAAGCAVAEVPITFRDRTLGESKFGMAIMAEALLGIPGLRRQARTGAAVTAAPLAPAPVATAEGIAS